MRLKRLEIHGFKSFRDKTIIHFDTGITGIVGPNGCGKSNIVDALFWVMGGQSPKLLRGNSMKDVIFAGSSKRAPSSFAEVALVLANPGEKKIRIGRGIVTPLEIKLSRKLYKNGETEYRINGSPVRLKDIQEVFFDTGAGAKSYSIIAQGEINRLIQSKPQERRTMIEEVAGIVKFKMRKKESLRKIAYAKENLNRVQDLKKELSKNLEQLGHQAEKAVLARKLKEKMKKNELIVKANEHFHFLSEIKTLLETVQTIKQNLEAGTNDKVAISAKLEQVKVLSDEFSSQLEQKQGLYNQRVQSITKAEEELKFLRKEKEDKKEQRELRLKEATGLQEELMRIEGDLKEAFAALTKASEFNYDEDSYRQLEDEFNELKAIMTLKESTVIELREEMEEERKGIRIVEEETFRLENALAHAQSDLEGLEEQIQEGQEEAEAQSQDLELGEQKAQELLEQIEGQKKEKELLQEQLAGLRKELKDLSSRQAALKEETILTQSKIDSSGEILRNMRQDFVDPVEFSESVQKAGAWVLGNKVKCDDEYARGIEALFLDLWHAILGASEENIEEMVQNLKEASELTFLSLGKETACSNRPASEASELAYEKKALEWEAYLKEMGCEKVLRCEEILDFSEVEGPNLRPLFRGSFLVDRFSPHWDFSRLPLGLATFDGQFVMGRPSGQSEQGLLLRYKDLSEKTLGPIELANQKEQYEKALLALTEKGRENQQALEKSEQKMLKTQAELEEKQKNLEAWNTDLATLLAQIEGYSRALKKINTVNESLKLQREKIQGQLLEKKDKLEEAQEEKGHLLEEFNERQEDLLQMQSELQEKKEKLEEVSERYLVERAQVTGLKREIEAHQKRHQELSDREKKLQKNLLYLEDLTQNLEKREKEAGALADELQVSVKEEAATLSLMEKEIKEQKQQQEAYFSQISELEEKNSDLIYTINQQDKDLSAAKTRLENGLRAEQEVARWGKDQYGLALREMLLPEVRFREEDRQYLWDDNPSNEEEDFSNGLREGGEEAPDYQFRRLYKGELAEVKTRLREAKSEFFKLGDINWVAIEERDKKKERYDFICEQETILEGSIADLDQTIELIDEKSKLRFAEAFENVNRRFQRVFPILFGGGEASLKIVGDLEDVECGVDIMARPPGKKLANINLLSGGEKALAAVSLIFAIFLVKPSPFCLLDEVDAPLDDANVGRFNDLLKEMSHGSQFILITHNKKTMSLNDLLYGVTMQEPGVSTAMSVTLQ